MKFELNDKVRLQSGDEGIVTRLNVLGAQKGIKILLDSGKTVAIFGTHYDNLKKI